MLQPVVNSQGSSGRASNRCIQFHLRSAPQIRNVAYIKFASLDMSEFDVRLDEAMARWAQGLADRVLWQLRADKSSFDEDVDSWPPPKEAFAGPDGVPGNHPWGGIKGSSNDGHEKRGVVLGHATVPSETQSRYLYLEVFQVSSVKVRLSLQRGKESEETVYVGIKPFQMLLDLMMRMDSAHIKLKPFVRHNETITRTRLINMAREHYLRELKWDVFQLLGSLEALGNPVGLVRGMGQGIEDLLMEPIRAGWNSDELVVDGIARGAKSFLKHSVGGVFNSASLITGKIQLELCYLFVHEAIKEYKVKRAQRIEKKGNPIHFVDGVRSGSVSLAKGFRDGLSGLYKDPLKGAQSGGLAGFAQGVGTGMLGLVVKPAVGMTDATTEVLQGEAMLHLLILHFVRLKAASPKGAHTSACKNSIFALKSSQLGTTHFAGSEGSSDWRGGVSQVRPRRVLYGKGRALRPYVLEDATANALLQSTSYQEEEYAAHLPLFPPSGPLVLLTHHLVMVIERNGSVRFAARLDSVQAIERTHDGILLHLHPNNEEEGITSPSIPGLPPTPLEQQQGKSSYIDTLGIPCPDGRVISPLYDLLNSAIKEVSGTEG
ncbi:unnamed protein product [Choristocarpus tenellus]